MLNLFARAALAAVWVLSPGSATAQLVPQHAIAMHGMPKYGPDFKHLDYVNPEAPKGGAVRLGVLGSFDNLNPYIIKGVSPPGRRLVFESLLKRTRDEPFSLYGLIAESVEVAADRSWVRFRLRPEARFHDGSGITADDVAFSFRTLRKSGRPNHRIFYAKVQSITQYGPHGIAFRFAPGAGREMPLIIGFMPILSKRYFSKVDFTKTTLVPPLGSGPYRIHRVAPGRAVVYRRIADYWGRHLPINRGQHNFNEIYYDFYHNSNALFEGFKSGEHDIRFENDPARWATSYDFPAVKKGMVKKKVFRHGRPAGIKGFVFNTRRSIFRDRKVRKALAHAFDFEWLNKNMFHGAYRRSRSFFANSELAAVGLPGADELSLLEPYRGQVPGEVFTKIYRPPITDGSGFLRRNLKQATGLLSRAGWGLKNKKLVSRATGREMSFEIMLVRPANERIALTFARNLERLGIQARVRTVDPAQYQSRIQDFDFDMVIKTWHQSLSPGNEQVYYWGSEAARLTGSGNLAGIRDAAVDALVRRITEARDRPGLIAATQAVPNATQVIATVSAADQQQNVANTSTGTSTVVTGSSENATSAAQIAAVVQSAVGANPIVAGVIANSAVTGSGANAQVSTEAAAQATASAAVSGAAAAGANVTAVAQAASAAVVNAAVATGANVAAVATAASSGAVTGAEAAGADVVAIAQAASTGAVTAATDAGVDAVAVATAAQTGAVTAATETGSDVGAITEATGTVVTTTEEAAPPPAAEGEAIPLPEPEPEPINENPCSQGASPTC